jgi:hypothetical protein
METWYTDNQNYNATVTDLRDIEASLASGVSAGTGLTVTGGADSYSLRVTSKTANTFTIAKANTGIVTRSCTRTNTKGGCPASQSW